MVALDNNAVLGSARIRRLTLKFTPKFILAPLVGGTALVAALLVLGAIIAYGFAENGFRLGSRLAWRYTFFVFFAALIAPAFCRLAGRFFPVFACPESLARRLIWGFCASYGVYLLSVFLPNVIRLSGGATLMVLFGGIVVLGMAVTTAPLKRLGGSLLIGEKTRRAILTTATVYFWSCYSLMALARISGPHRPEAFYDISLSLMMVALLLCYADRWFARRDQAAEDLKSLQV
jgi:hypothetical protein